MDDDEVMLRFVAPRAAGYEMVFPSHLPNKELLNVSRPNAVFTESNQFMKKKLSQKDGADTWLKWQDLKGALNKKFL